jgi:germination protein M
MAVRALRTLLITSLLIAGAACGGDDATPSTDPSIEPTTTGPTTTGPTTTGPTTTAITEPTTEPTTPTTEPATTEPATTEPATTEPTTTTEPATIDVRVYFLRGERLVIDHREVEGPAVLRGALTALVAGPSGDLLTIIPDGTALLGVNLADGTATVDLSEEFGSGGGTLSLTARVAQVVFTATQFDNVDRVVLWIEGAPIEYLGGEGLVMSEPWTRADVARGLTGGVLVDSPRPGDTVTSPFTVTGEADVFEGDFPIEIRRGDAVLTIVAPVAGGAWGDWADFTTTVTVDAEPGPIELVAYDEGGCGDAPECPPIIETVVPLTLG